MSAGLIDIVRQYRVLQLTGVYPPKLFDLNPRTGRSPFPFPYPFQCVALYCGELGPTASKREGSDVPNPAINVELHRLDYHLDVAFRQRSLPIPSSIDWVSNP